jgi:imidazolonepropionase-like amidohydrolase
VSTSPCDAIAGSSCRRLPVRDERLGEPEHLNYPALFQAGVKIALGTDFAGPVGVAHGENAAELEILVEQVGMSPMQAIASATRIGAEALGLEDEIGTLSPGKQADLTWTAIPQRRRHPQAKAAIELVMKSGRITRSALTEGGCPRKA